MAKYWLCVVNEENWKVVKNKNVWGVSEKYRKSLGAVEIGDFLTFYVKKSKVGGIFVTFSEPFISTEKLYASADPKKQKIYPHRIRLRPVVVPEKLKDFKPLIPELKFIVNKKKWFGSIRLAMRTIPKEDFELIKNFLESGQVAS